MSNNPPNRHSTLDERWAWFNAHYTSVIKTRLYREAYRILQNPSDAEDILQTAITIVVENCWQLHDSSRFYAWMFTIVRREAYRLQRNTLRVIVCDLQQHANIFYAAANPEHLIISEEAFEELRREMAQLKSPEKEILQLKVSTDKNLREIAAELGLNYHTTRSKFNRTQHYLQKKLREGERNEKK